MGNKSRCSDYESNHITTFRKLTGWIYFWSGGISWQQFEYCYVEETEREEVMVLLLLLYIKQCTFSFVFWSLPSYNGLWRGFVYPTLGDLNSDPKLSSSPLPKVVCSCSDLRTRVTRKALLSKINVKFVVLPEKMIRALRDHKNELEHHCIVAVAWKYDGLLTRIRSICELVVADYLPLMKPIFNCTRAFTYTVVMQHILRYKLRVKSTIVVLETILQR